MVSGHSSRRRIRALLLCCAALLIVAVTHCGVCPAEPFGRCGSSSFWIPTLLPRPARSLRTVPRGFVYVHEDAILGFPEARAREGRVMFEVTVLAGGNGTRAGWARRGAGEAREARALPADWGDDEEQWAGWLMEPRDGEAARSQQQQADGDVLGCAIDLDSGNVMEARNGVWRRVAVRVDTPKSGTYPAVSAHRSLFSLNVGQAPFRYPLQDPSPGGAEYAPAAPETADIFGWSIRQLTGAADSVFYQGDLLPVVVNVSVTALAFALGPTPPPDGREDFDEEPPGTPAPTQPQPIRNISIFSWRPALANGTPASLQVHTRYGANLTVPPHFWVESEWKEISKSGAHLATEFVDPSAQRPPQGERVEQVRRLLWVLADLLAEAGVRWWLDWGSLLGSVRDQVLIPWDTDGDVAIHAGDVEKFRAFAERRLLAPLPACPACLLIVRWPRPLPNATPVGQRADIPYIWVNMTSGVYIDVFKYFVIDKKVSNRMMRTYNAFEIGESAVFPLRANCTLHNRTFPCPRDCDAYLREQIGPTWRYPMVPEHLRDQFNVSLPPQMWEEENWDSTGLEWARWSEEDGQPIEAASQPEPGEEAAEGGRAYGGVASAGEPEQDDPVFES
eukprot:TRINITY_DN15937_c0_g1_i1.p1 TRINITY_DN15937_c0_g1~~TRINITY_DN15937_c0_g1_i1.p1  ORF type:complete len:647 (+),score=140.24 TRINITY_DN15937_c0_g1_i1:87-1943(+)